MGQGFKALALTALLISPVVSAAPTIVAGSQGTTSGDSAIYEFSSSADISVLVEAINQPQKMAVAPDGDIFIADVGGSEDVIWRLTPEGQLSPYYTFSGDAMANPYPVVYGTDGTIYTTVAVDITVPTTALVAISPSLERRTIATFVGSSYGMAMDRSGNFYVGVRHLGTSQLLKVTPAGTVTTAIASLPGPIWDVARRPDPTTEDTLFLAVHPSSIYTWNPIRPHEPYLFAEVDQPLSLAFGSTGYLYVGQNNGRVSKVGPSGNTTLVAEGFRGDPITGIAVRTPEALAGRTWLSINATWNVPIEEMLAACDRTTGRCTGSVFVHGRELDLSGFVWASPAEVLDYVSASTTLPVADLIAGWYLDCDNFSDECPPEFGLFWDFVEANETISGTSYQGFHGVDREYKYFLNEHGNPAVTTWHGWLYGEGWARFYTGAVDLVAAQTCSGYDCERYGYFLYKPTLQPTRLSSISLSKTTVAGCKSVTGNVALTAPAPAGGLTVVLSDTLSAATVPASVTIAAGATNKNFTIKTLAVSAAQIGTVSATLDGRTLSQGLTVRPMGMYSVSLSPTKAVGGNKVAGKVTLECKAPSPAGIMVDLASTNAAVATPVAASIAIPAGYQSWSFDVATNPVLAKTSATISGTANGITKSRALTVTPAASISATRLTFGNQAVGTRSGPLFVTLYNNGALAFSVDSVGVTGTYASWFAFTTDCPGSLPAGASCMIGVTFTPKGTGSRSATLRIATSATATPLSVSLSGTGVSPP